MCKKRAVIGQRINMQWWQSLSKRFLFFLNDYLKTKKKQTWKDMQQCSTRYIQNLKRENSKSEKNE